eukprot:2302189-Pleurochrysis_carterae.AAC.1
MAACTRAVKTACTRANPGTRTYGGAASAERARAQDQTAGTGERRVFRAKSRPRPAFAPECAHLDGPARSVHIRCMAVQTV